MDYVIAIVLLAILAAAVFALLKIVKRIRPRYVHWKGRGTYDHELEASAEYQPILFRLAGGERRRDVTQEVVAALHVDPPGGGENSDVRVSVRGRTVGYMSPADARLYLGAVRKAGYTNIVGKCDAIIVGGRKKGIDSKEHFGILLDLPSSTGLTEKAPPKKH